MLVGSQQQPERWLKTEAPSWDITRKGQHITESPMFRDGLRSTAVCCESCSYWHEPEQVGAGDICHECKEHE